jgi:hypothetical protein
MTQVVGRFFELEGGEGLRKAVVPLFDCSIPRNQGFIGVTLHEGVLWLMRNHEDGNQLEMNLDQLMNLLTRFGNGSLDGLRRLLSEGQERLDRSEAGEKLDELPYDVSFGDDGIALSELR